MEKEYIRKYIILGSALTIAAAALMLWLPERINLAAALSPAYMALASIFTLRLMDRPKYENMRKFANAVMAINIGKMMLALTYIVVTLLLSAQEQKIPFIVLFLTIYAVFTVLDTRDLLKIFKEKDSNPRSQK